MKLFYLIPVFFSWFFSLDLYAEGITVSSINVVSNTRTKDFIIIQELDFTNGKTYERKVFEEEISNSVQNLKNLGIFGDVNIDYKMTNGMSADVVVTANDKWTLFPIPFYYYDNKIGSSIMVSVSEENLVGLNQTLEIDYNYESIPDYQDVSIQYSYPRVFGSYFNTAFSISYLQYYDTIYDSNGDLSYKALHTSFSNYIRVDRKFRESNSQWTVFIDSGLQFETNEVMINNEGQNVINGLSFYPGIGVEEGIVNYDLGAIWGHFYRLKVAVSPLSSGFQTELRADEYFRFWEKSGIAIRADFQSSSIEELLLTSDEARGVSLGQIRGNYLMYGNFEFRPYLFTITWPTDLDFYLPLFIDAGDGILSNQGLENGSSIITAGFGLRFYPKYFGGSDSCIRLDFGAILPYLLAGESFDRYFYFAFNFQDEFD